MTNYLLGLGGSGGMAVRAFLHLAALGSPEAPENRTVIRLIDPDLNSPETASANKTAKLLSELTDPDSVWRQSFGGEDGGKTLFRLSVLHEDGDLFDLRSRRFPETVKEMCEDRSETDAILLDAFFSRPQQAETTHASPANASLLFGYMDRLGLIERDVAARLVDKKEQCRVTVVGSVFGATGAGMLLNAALAIKKLDPRRVETAVVAILPFFTLRTGDGEKATDALFEERARAALGRYSSVLEQFGKQPGGDMLLPDRLYLAAPPNGEKHNCTGSTAGLPDPPPRPADLTDLIAAGMIADFFNAPPGSLQKDGSGKIPIYGMIPPAPTPEKPLTAREFAPAAVKKAGATLLFSAAVFALRAELRAASFQSLHRLHWLSALCGGRKNVRGNASDVKERIGAALDRIVLYCADFSEFMGSLPQSGRPRDPGGQDCGDRCRICGETEAAALLRVGRILSKGNIPPADELKAILSCRTYLTEKSRVCAADALAAKLYRPFRKRGLAPEQALAAYLNALFVFFEKNASGEKQ